MKLLGRVALQCRSVSKPQKRIFSQILNILVLNVYMQLMIIKQLRKTFHMKNISKKKNKNREKESNLQETNCGLMKFQKMIINILRKIKGDTKSINKNMMLFKKKLEDKKEL